jgi:membrane protein involved in colicin uptake
MKKRYSVLGLSLVLALALAVPAFGGPSNPIASVSADAKTIAERALKQAKAAKKAAKAARATANSAGDAAGAASSAAAKAQKTAESAQGTANTAKTSADSAKTTATTAQNTANTAKATADSAKTAAAAAQAAADSAKAIAETKMSDPSQVEGEGGTTASAAGCGDKTPTGGGFIVLGNDNDAATVTQSTQYLSGWIVLADQIEGTTGTSWEVIATVNCATAP